MEPPECQKLLKQSRNWLETMQAKFPGKLSLLIVA